MQSPNPTALPQVWYQTPAVCITSPYIPTFTPGISGVASSPVPTNTSSLSSSYGLSEAQSLAASLDWAQRPNPALAYSPLHVLPVQELGPTMVVHSTLSQVFPFLHGHDNGLHVAISNIKVYGQILMQQIHKQQVIGQQYMLQVSTSHAMAYTADCSATCILHWKGRIFGT